MPKPISVIFTGGTICCVTDDKGTRSSNVKATGYLLTEHYHERFGDAQQFKVSMPVDSLSENLKPSHWDILLQALREVSCGEVAGVIIAHGTDSLAETVAMLSAALLGYPLPVVLVSAHSPLDAENTNGHSNFAAAVELIQRGLPQGVWAVYENLDGVVYLHHGAKLRPCANESQEFFSRDMHSCRDADFTQFVMPLWKGITPLEQMRPFAETEDILLLRPYVGQRYDRVLLDGIAAVVHGTYHSETANSHDESPYSVRYLLKKTKARKIPCFLAPCQSTAQQYVSAKDLIGAGITPLPAASVQLAYGAAYVGAALGYCDDALRDWVITVCQWFER